MSKQAPYEIRRAIAEKASRLWPNKWISVDTARIHIAGLLIESFPESDCPEDDEELATEALRQAGELLVAIISSGEVVTRGVEHAPPAPPVFHKELDLVWWHRVIVWEGGVCNPLFIEGGHDDLPAHHMLWQTEELVRALPKSPEERLALVTDIEVNAEQFHAVVKVDAIDAERAAQLRQRVAAGRKRDDGQWSVVRRIAKQLIRERFESVERFAVEVAERYTEADPESIDAKQVKRILFGG